MNSFRDSTSAACVVCTRSIDLCTRVQFLRVRTVAVESRVKLKEKSNFKKATSLFSSQGGGSGWVRAVFISALR
eukprot:3997353-Lingulodinium_polyedra.AAC.1